MIDYRKTIPIRIVIVCCFAFFSTTVFSQIQRNFWGLELGRSTKTEVRDFMKKNDLTPGLDTGGKDVLMTFEGKIGLGGYLWSPSFEFYNGYLSTINLWMDNEEVTNYGEIVDNSNNNTFTFYNLRSKLRNKYPNVESVVNNQNPDYSYILRDEKTLIMLELTEDKNLNLTYGDRRLLRMEKNGSGF